MELLISKPNQYLEIPYPVIYLFEHNNIYLQPCLYFDSVCTNASWVCEDDNCEEQIICPENQEKVVGQSTAPLTCRNPNPTTSPTVYVTCGCSNGLYMTDTVSQLFFIYHYLRGTRPNFPSISSSFN